MAMAVPVTRSGNVGGSHRHEVRAGGLRQWLQEMPLGEFVGTYLHRAPVARPSAAAAAVPLLGWETLGRILAAEPAPDTLVVARGRLVDAPAPRSLEALARLMAAGVGLVLRRTERCDAGLAALAASFAADLGGHVHVQVFVTPGGTHGFGWHHDAEHVFVAQTVGVKDYYFRANTVSPPFERCPDFTLFHHERSPVATARLLAGDWLYIPSRWWHMARCVEDSLSISLGVFL
jgi:hypothetical protein